MIFRKRRRKLDSGLDLYSLFESAHEVVKYLDTIDPPAAQRARERYSCFDRFGHNTQTYGYATAFGMSKSCESEITKQLIEMLRRKENTEGLFYATQNARLVKNAEEYHRCRFTKNTWNMRDHHMVDTLGHLIKHYKTFFDIPDAKVVVWAHNSHVGDGGFVSAKEQRGETNIGEIVRQKYGINNTFNIGFSTYDGTVTAADDWDTPAKEIEVIPATIGSYEDLFHKAGIPWFFLLFRSNDLKEFVPDERVVKYLEEEQLERAIGVIYRPETERQTHYFHAIMSKQFDTAIHIDRTSSVVPTDKPSSISEEPEIYPFGI